MYLVGVDTGGTKTKCIVLDQQFRLLGSATSGPGNYHVAGVDGAKANVEMAIRGALNDADVETAERLVGGFGMGTLDTPEDRRIINEFLDDISFVDERHIENDVITAHYATTAGDSGITVVAGTGAMAYGIGDDGTAGRSSGWGWLIGDEGSGFDAARRGLQAATRAYDGRGEQTALVNAAREYFDLDDFENLFDEVYEGLDHSKNIAPFAECVTDAARNGDAVAQRIVADAADELAVAAYAVKQELQLDSPVQVGCVGGFGTSDIVAERFEAAVQARIPDVEFLTSVNHPVVGCVVIVAEALGRPIDRETLQALDTAIEQDAAESAEGRQETVN